MSVSQSSFDIQISVIQNIISSCNQDSQRIQSDIKRAREQLQGLKVIIENKNQSCIRQLEPRIQQLQQKIQVYWQGVSKMNQAAYKDLEHQEAIFEQCQNYVKRLDDRILRVEDRI